MKRSPISRDTEKSRAWLNKPRQRLRQRSARQVRKDREFNVARRQVLERDEWTCQLAIRMDGHHCGGGLEVHHIRRRSQGGSNDPSNLVTLCSEAHHGFVHKYPQEAALFGLLILRPEHEGEAH